MPASTHASRTRLTHRHGPAVKEIAPSSHQRIAGLAVGAMK